MSSGVFGCNELISRPALAAVLDECRASLETGANSTMALTFDFVSVAEGREPSGFAVFTGHSPDGSRRSAYKAGLCDQCEKSIVVVESVTEFA